MTADTDPPSSHSKNPTLGLAGDHLRKTLNEFGEGITARLKTLRETVITEPAEEIAWEISAKLNRMKTRVFKQLDRRIDRLIAKKHSKDSEELEEERFDSEGGAMKPTPNDSKPQSAHP